jgi:aminoglycoside/choline kinase family phosphotransferase
MPGSLASHLEVAAHSFGLTHQEVSQAVRLAGDAGTRSYFRLSRKRLLVTYPEPFSAAQANWSAIAEALKETGLRVPTQLADDPGAGAALIEDLGDRDLSVELREAPTEESRSSLLDEAESLLARLRQIGQKAATRNPAFDPAFFAGELAQTRHWYLEEGGASPLAASERQLWEEQTTELCRRAMSAQGGLVPVHRDFHANNILRSPEGSLALIDFQDLRLGPPDYDRVSLRFERGGTLVDSDPASFSESVLLQRAWKVLGTFAKLLSWGRETYRPFFDTARSVLRAQTRPGSDFRPLLRFLR